MRHALSSSVFAFALLVAPGALALPTGDVGPNRRAPAYTLRDPSSSPLQTGRAGSIGIGSFRVFTGRKVETSSNKDGVQMRSAHQTRGWAFVSKPAADGTFTVRGVFNGKWSTTTKLGKLSETVTGTTGPKEGRKAIGARWEGKRSDGTRVEGWSAASRPGEPRWVGQHSTMANGTKLHVTSRIGGGENNTQTSIWITKPNQNSSTNSEITSSPRKVRTTRTVQEQTPEKVTERKIVSETAGGRSSVTKSTSERPGIEWLRRNSAH